jgi:hypothetical protein
VSLVLFAGCPQPDGDGGGIVYPFEVPKTGQTLSYAAWDDGELKMGSAWPDPRFTVTGDTVTDNLTGLIWAKDGNLMATRDPGFDNDGTAGDGRVTWDHALDYIDKLNTESYLGHTDWRLPNRKELRSLTNFGVQSAEWLNGMGFINIIGDSYKTSTDYNDPEFFASVSIYNGRERDNNKSSPQPVFPVRGDSNYLPKTGQTASTRSGDDGDLEMGIAWPDPRFVDNGNGTITDQLTGLMWIKDANLMITRDPDFDQDDTVNDGAVTWQHAIDYATKLRTENYLGYSDWRIPNVNEMDSICSAEMWSQKTWLESKGFINVDTYLYWTSTTSFQSADFALIFWAGKLGIGEAHEKSEYLYVFLVRGGE